MKFNRTYRAFIVNNGVRVQITKDFRVVISPEYVEGRDYIIIEHPITCQFDINRDLYSEHNKAQFTFYNLSLKKQGFLYQDKFLIDNYKRIYFEAGYEGQIGLIFSSDILQGRTRRQRTEMLTELECMEGLSDWQNAMTSATYNKGIIGTQLIEMIVQDTGFKKGYITDINTKYERGYTYQGRSMDAIKEISDGNAFVDLDTVNVIKDNEVIGESPMYISAETGLLDEPTRQDTVITMKMLFEPKIRIGQLVVVDSSLKLYNGKYKVLSVHHSGIISGAVSGECTSEITLFIGVQPFRLVG